MKVAIIRQRYVPHGGAERVISRLVDALIKRGHTVHLFANQWREDILEHPALVFRRVPMLRGGSFFRLISFAFFCWVKIRKESFDIVHSFERTLRQNLYRAGDGCHREWLNQRAKRLSMLGRVRLYCNPFHWATLWIEKRIYAGGGTEKIIVNSNRGKEEIIRHYRASPEKIRVIYNGVDLQRFHPDNRVKYREEMRTRWGIDETTFVLLFVGSGFERKGLRCLIQAAGRLYHKHGFRRFKIVVAGKGKREKYLRTAQSIGIETHLHFVGTSEKIEQIYVASDLLVLPTLYDPFANVCLEAMASELPVITTRTNGASELLTGPLTSLILDEAEDAEGLARLLFELTDAPRRSELGRLSRAVSNRFSEETHFEKVIALYDSLGRQRKKTGA